MLERKYVCLLIYCVVLNAHMHTGKQNVSVCVYVRALKSSLCGSSLAVGSPLSLRDIRIYEIFVGDVQFEDTVPAIQVRL